MNLRDGLPGAASLSQTILGTRGLPQSAEMARRHLPLSLETASPLKEPTSCSLPIPSNRYFEPENLRAAETVLHRTGLAIAPAAAETNERPLCCGRTFLAAGLAETAKAEMLRTAAAIRPALERGAYVVGLEPSCVLTFRDEAPVLLGDEWNADLGSRVLLLEEFIALKQEAGEIALPHAAGQSQQGITARTLPSEGFQRW